MPPKIKIQKEEIICAATELVREKGEDALNSRNLAKALGCSTQPLFSNFENMEELRGEVIKRAAVIYGGFTKDEIEKGNYPAYKASGMAYIRFAKEERELFTLLFMRDRTFENKSDDEIEPIVKMIMGNVGISHEDAKLFHLEMWSCVHGIAAMIATDYLELDTELVSLMLTDIYQGLRARFESRG
ncbi:MAG: TetR/AcrR family transcriptional regulator [Ruminococcaceae bacterium]|nr:TetR/AcrR family transcriptional regulator [Oscillospiraceae bacterium]